MRDACMALAIGVSIYSKTATPKKMEKMKKEKLKLQIAQHVKHIYRAVKQPYGSSLGKTGDIFNAIQKWLRDHFQYSLLVHSLDVADLKQTKTIFNGTVAGQDEKQIVRLLISHNHCIHCLFYTKIFFNHLFRLLRFQPKTRIFASQILWKMFVCCAKKIPQMFTRKTVVSFMPYGNLPTALH